MGTRRGLIAIATVIAGAGMILGTAPAAADAGGDETGGPANRTAVTPPRYTLANGICAGPIRMLASPTTTRPGHAYIQVIGAFTGISGDAAPCRVVVSVDWRNLRTGRAGTVTGWVAGTQIPFVPTQALQREVATGHGAIELRLRSHHLHQPVDPIRVTVS